MQICWPDEALSYDCHFRIILILSFNVLCNKNNDDTSYLSSPYWGIASVSFILEAPDLNVMDRHDMAREHPR